MTAFVQPSVLKGTASAIPSKSAAHRIILAALLCRQKTKINISALSKDIKASLDCAEALGADVEYFSDGVIITPSAKYPSQANLDCNESGTTLRLFLPCVASLTDSAEIIGNGRLMQRPLSPLKEELEKNGASLELDNGSVLKTSGKLKSGEYTLPGNVSSQFISGLLFALPMLYGDSKIIITSPLESAGYVDMTLDVLSKFGIVITKTNYGYFVYGSQVYTSPEEITVEGDWSNAAFWLCAGALGGKITVKGLAFDSLQGDKAVLNILEQMGAEIHANDNDISVKANDRLSAIEIDGSQIPDLIPILAATACFAKGETVFKSIGRLKLKESDRIASICHMINSCGGSAVCGEDFIKIIGTDSIKGGTANSHNDHRIAMSLAVLGVFSQCGVEINDAAAVEKSYTSFYEALKNLGGSVQCHQ